MSKWYIDEHGYVMEEGNPGTYFDYCDAHWRSGLYSISTDNKVLIENIANHLLSVGVSKWQRHPNCSEEGMFGRFSRDQLILVIAALRYHKLDNLVNQLNDELTLYTFMAKNQAPVTAWFKIWLRRVSGKKSILDSWLFIALLADLISYRTTKKGAYVVHLWGWMLWSLPNGIFKNIGWTLFNLVGYNKPTWSGVKDNYLYCYMQGKTPAYTVLEDCEQYLWQEGETPVKPAKTINTVQWDILNKVVKNG